MDPICTSGTPAGADAEGGVGTYKGRQQIQVERALCQRQRWQETQIQSCMLLGVIEVVRARLDRLLLSLGRCVASC